MEENKTNVLLLVKKDCDFAYNLRKELLKYNCEVSYINGFDEDYVAPAYGEDTDLVWRFQMAGYHFISLRNLAVQYHLWHPLSWTDQSENMALGNSKRMQGEYRCLNGLSKHSPTYSAT